MEHYKKGKNIEEELHQDNIPIPNLPRDFLWMHVKGGSKISNLITFALEKFPNEVHSVVWSGSGTATTKTISCAEIMKRKFSSDIHQITKICYRKIEEYWEPKIEGLDQIVVNRNVPTIHIYLSINPLNTEEPGYQAPGKKLTNVSKQQKQKTNQQRKQNERGSTSTADQGASGHNRAPTEQFAALGVRDNKRKHLKKPYEKQKTKTINQNQNQKFDEKKL